MVKLKNIIGYKWENKNYPGHLIAVHKDGKIIAYSINVNGQGMVRVFHFGIGNKRALIKGMSKEILDLQFANSSKDVIIGCIEEAALHIHKLEITDSPDGTSMNCIQLLKIESALPDHVPLMDKISWCPFVPEESNVEEEFSVLLLVWVRGNKFECFSVKTILDTHGTGVHKQEDITDGIVKSHDDERSLITSVTFSPDGTTLAIGCASGFIRFYQIYFHEATPRCLHAWNPHDGAPISDFFFLDNHTQPISGSTLWKYVVTLANNNTEIKISSCDSWKTLQSIQFKSAIGQELSFKAEIDRTSSYLILSDMANRQLYVLQILKENALSQNGNEDVNTSIARVFVKSIAEFHLASTILSYAISNASIRRYKCALSENYLIDELEDFDEENSSLFCVVLKIFMILPESVQECHILYQTALNQSAEILKTEVTESKTPTFLNISAANSDTTKKNDMKTTPPQKTPQLNLLTPDSFSSPIDKSKCEVVSQEVLSTIFMLAKTNTVVPTNCSLISEGEKIFPQKIPTESAIAQIQLKSMSGGSSPSREVRDIMLQADSVNEDYYPGEDDDMEMDEPEDKAVLNALNALDVSHFKNIDDDEDDDEVKFNFYTCKL
jgi:enhancer of mRNA-decapping protein 4